MPSNLIDITAERNALEIERDRLLQDIINLENNITTLEDRIIELETTIAGLNDEILVLENSIVELEINYDILRDSYDTLEIQYNALQIAYDYITDTIRQSIFPVQYSIFAEAVRRYYMPLYLVDGMTNKEWYMGYAEFCRDMILHDSEQYNAFSEVSNAFNDTLVFGNDTMYLAYFIMTYVFWSQVNPIHWLPNWDGCDLTGNELTDINTIVDWCIDEINYEYDLDITLWQEDPTWDYPKFPVETAFRTFGDCEDQAILTATYLESCGFETVIAISHDPAHPTIGEFYHGHLLVHIEDIVGFKALYYPRGGRVHVAFSDTLKAVQFQHFLEGIIARYKNAGKILMVLDNARAHHSKELAPFLKTNKDKLELMFLPSYSPDLNPMEWFWKFLRKKVTHNTFFSSFKKFQRGIAKFILKFKLTSKEIKTRCSFARLFNTL